MQYIIPKGKHRPKGFPNSWWFGKEPVRFWVMYDESWKQTFPGHNKDDISKTFGIGCFNIFWAIAENIRRVFKGEIKKKGIASPHHWKSVRFGQDYNEERNCMTTYAYCYNKGVRKSWELMDFELCKMFLVEIHPYWDDTDFVIYNKNMVLQKTEATGITWNGISVLLGPYFGGENPTQHDTTTFLKRL